jgi:hypothetical protein
MLKERKDALRSGYEDKTPTTMAVMRIIIDPQSRISFRQYLRLNFTNKMDVRHKKIIISANIQPIFDFNT